jgi:hypothetical protein
MRWEYFDRMILFQDSEQGMVSGLDSWINGADAEGWIGTHPVFQRPVAAAAG